MGYRIGLDLGITSVGWAVLEDDKDGNPRRIIDLGTRIFDAAENPKDGSPLAEPRRNARSLRRRLRRKSHRVKRTKQLLEKYGIITQEEIENMYKTYNFQFTPYELRVDALDNKLTNSELARVLISMAKKRGYKSNSKAEENTSGSDAGKLLTATKENEELMKVNGYRTVAEMYLNDRRFKIIMPDGSEMIKIKNSPNEYRNTPLRKLLVEEIKLILNKQKEFNNLITDEFISDYLEIFESQRNFDEGPGDGPYSGNQIEKMIGHCTFEPNEIRAPKACYTFEYFKLLQDINHIKIERINEDNRVEKRELSEEERNQIIELAKRQVTITYDTLRKVLNLEDNERFNMVNYEKVYSSDKEDIKKSEKGRKSDELKSYHEIRKALDRVEKDYINNLSWDELDVIGYGLTTFKSDEKRLNYFKENNLKIKEDFINELLKLSFSKYGNLSIKCMKNIIPHLEKGLTYDKAVGQVYPDHRGIINTTKKTKLSLNDLEERITNPVVRRAVSQTIKVINAINNKYISLYGKPDAVVVELARELGKSKNERNNIQKNQESNRALNERVKREIEKLGKPNVTGQDIVKYRLWQEQDGRCLYSGKAISPEDLFTEAVDVDHIIPYSMCYDDSYNNKVLVLSSENRQKGNRIPYEYIKESGRNIEEYEVRIDAYVRSYQKKRRLLKESYSRDDIEEQKERNLNDTRYITKTITKLINNYMEFSDKVEYKRRVLTVNGRITAYVRRRLGIEKIRANGDEHHAVDAAVIAVISQKFINSITRFAQYMDARRMKNTGEYIDYETGEIVNAKEFEEKYGTRFPEPWDKFRKELEIRSSIETKERMEDVIKAEKIMSYYEHDDGIDRFEDLEPIFISRMPRRKVKGEVHKETIRGLKKENGIIKTVTKTDLVNLKLDNKGEIKNYSEKAKKDDRLLYEALREQLQKHGGDGKEAFKEKFYKPKSDGTKGPLVKKVKLEEKTTLGVELNNGRAIADNGGMVRIDVFYVENEGYYFVPIYIADTLKEKLPNKACIPGKNYEDWKEMDEKNFIFSLYPNDLIRIVGNGKIKLNGNKDKEKDSIEVDELFAYYIKAGISVASITIVNHDSEYIQPNLGIKSLKSIEKYTVDVLGNYNKVKLPEKRQKFNIK